MKPSHLFLLPICALLLFPPSLQLHARNVVISAAKTDSTGDSRYGAFSEEGEQILPFEYSWIWRNEWGLLLAYVENRNRLLVFNSSGTPFIADTVDRVRDVPYESNRIAVESGGKWGFFNEEGKQVIKFKYEQVSNFYNGYAKCILKGKTIAIDTNGREVSLKKVRGSDYDLDEMAMLTMIGSFNDDKFTVREKEGLYGLVDNYDNWTIQPLYDQFRENFHGKTIAIRNGNWGVLDYLYYPGKIIIPFEYHELRVLW